ncbi:MAG: ribonuclease J [Patescibacteria group bacterium]
MNQMRTSRLSRTTRIRTHKPKKELGRVLVEPKKTDGKIDEIKIIPLGGLGEVGKNMTAIECGNEILIIDAGLRFPEEDMPGIDFIIPNVSYLEYRKDRIVGLIITHGHYDHIGALPYLREKIGDPEIYTGALTRGMLIKRQEDFSHQPALKINLVSDGDEVKIGENFNVKFFHVNHSIPDDFGVAITTIIGTVVHTSDFKFDATPLYDKPANYEQIKHIGDKGVMVLMSESTGAELDGHSLSEKDIQENLDLIFREAKGMIVAGTFASMINRIQQLIVISEKYGRKVVVDGYSMKTNTEISKELGYIKMQKGTQIKLEQVNDHPREKITAIVTGAQGEGNAALMRIVNGEHRHIRLQKNDTVMFSSSVIPGNERNVQILRDQLYRQGIKVYHYQMMDIHTGGHAKREDLREMIQLIRPKFFMPVHGQYSMMINHIELAKEEGVPEANTIVADNGSIIHITPEKWWLDKETAPSSYVFVDGLGIGDVGNVVLRDRQVLAQDGMFVIVTTVDSRTGRVRTSPDIISRGFVYLRENTELLNEVRKKVRAIVERKTVGRGPINWIYLKDEIKEKVGSFLFQKTERRPMVLPVVIEV